MSSSMRCRDFHIQAGETRIDMFEWGNPNAQSVWFQPHRNEAGAAEAALAVLPECDARFIQFAQPGDRRISFAVAGETWTFDANRLFSPTGIATTLGADGRPATPEAIAALTGFTEQLREKLAMEKASSVVAVHTTGNPLVVPVNVDDYMPKGKYSGAVVDIHRNPTARAEDFFLVVDRTTFDGIRALNYSVVLEKDDPNIGYMSVYCALLGVRFVNCEALHNTPEHQAQMLRAMWSVLSRL